MPQPYISIVVPVYNGETVIAECIESLLALEDPKEKLEILIVDNNSTDGTGAIIQQYPVTALSETTQGDAARNRGIIQAQSEIVAFTDADCIVDRNWVQEIAKAFQDDVVEAVMGFADGINANIVARFEQRRWEGSWFYKTDEGDYRMRKKGIDTRNCAIRKRTFDRCGLFDPAMRYCGDWELSIRLNRGHCHIAFNPRMKVWHKNPTSLSVIQEKGQKRLPFLLRLMRGLPKGLNWDDVPFPRSAFHGLSTLEMGAFTLTCVFPILRSVRRLLLAMVQLGVRFNLAYPGMFKLYKIYLGMSYDMAILQAKRIQRWG